ncbi:hypothetical protein FACS1894181_01440 [Bacteroidia bacterium]|nr:hypothetical protein FACS1894181_01440 [Bacteroidia bacterium]
MRLSRFKTFVTSYYFPEITKDTGYLYNLYHPYKTKLAQIYWWLYKNCVFVRLCTAIKEEKLDFPYKLIKAIEKNNSIMSFGMGSPGREQKISILGFDPVIQIPFFAKFAQKPKAMELSKNEIEVLKKLQSSGLVPVLYHYKIADNYVFLKTECIKGKRPSSVSLTNEIIDILLSLVRIEYTNTENSNQYLKFCFSHGDFCPWNIIQTEEKLRLIDWEMAKYRPFGYDLFTYIFQPFFLLHPQNKIQNILQENISWINTYFNFFQIKDWDIYLIYFVDSKLNEEIEKHNIKLIQGYQLLNDYIKNTVSVSLNI